MSFGGSVAAMIASIKANKRRRVSAFDKMKNLKKGGNIQLYFKNKATPKQLHEIREKLQKENKKQLRIRIALILILLIIIIYVIGFVKI